MKDNQLLKWNFSGILIAIILIVLMLQILMNPVISINSAKEGLELWFNLLLPSLLPFLFISCLLISLGFVDFLGKFLEPLMKPIFNVSGIGIFPFTMSIMSGYPIGAKLTSNLRENNLITRAIGNRLLSFSSTSGPLFIIGTVTIGMLGHPELSPLLIIPHYISAITIGLFFRFYKNKETLIDTNSHFINNTYANLHINNKEKSIGSLISTCIKDSMDSMIIIGGFIIVYSVIIDLLLSSNIFNLFINTISNYTSIDANLLKGITAGIIELTNGCKIVSSLNIDLIIKIIVINFLIGWAGFSIHSQAISFISSTDLSIKIYLFAKFIHGLLSSFYTYVLYIFIYKDIISTTFSKTPILIENPNINNWLSLFISSTKITLSLIVFLILLSIFINELKFKKI